MKAQTKAQTACDITIGVDHGSLRLQFPSRHAPLWEALEGKSLKGKPKYLPLGKHGYKDNPEDWKRAQALAIQMEADLDHPEWEKLFDITLAKYGLGGGKYAKLADVLQMPGTVATEPEMTVGEMWEDYLIWKEGQLQPTTFQQKFKKSYTNALKGLSWDRNSLSYSALNPSIWECYLTADIGEKALTLKLNRKSQECLLLSLNEAFLRAQALGKARLTTNPFHQLWKQTEINIGDKYKPIIDTDGQMIEWWQIEDAKGDKLENDRRAFSKEERDIIIKAFYNSHKDSERYAAPLIEFLFLTGCRPGEAFALRWQDIMIVRGVIRFSKSYNGSLKNIQQTKTGTIRMFRLYPELTNLLLKIKPLNAEGKNRIFEQIGGEAFNTGLLSYYWLGDTRKRRDSTIKDYPGVVTRLVQEGRIGTYLSPYHTRHTYITLTAWANKGDTSALMLLAHECGNSVEIILAHYLGVNKEVLLLRP